MDLSLQESLRERYPALLCDPPDSPIGERGIEVGNGWSELLVTVFNDLERAAQSEGSEVPAILQVKEKFGLLRITVRNPTDAIDDVLRKAEQASTAICETCGKPGAPADRPGQMRVRCPACS